MRYDRCVGMLCVCVWCIWCGICKGELPDGLALIAGQNGSEHTCRRILQDGESLKTLFDPEERSFYVNEPLQIRLIKKRELLLRFYSPRSVRNVVLWASLSSSGEQFKLAEFSYIPAFAEYRIPLSFLKTRCTYPTRSGGEIRLEKKDFDKETFKLEIESSDSYYRQLIATDCRWKISFGDYTGEHWRPLQPAHAREAVAVALNMAYLFSTNEFREMLGTCQGKFFKDNQGTEIDTKDLYNRIFNLPALVYGRVSGVNGLGGGTIFGLAEWCYLEHYADAGCITHTLFHEFAHCLGYTHEGNMTYENNLGRGWVSFCGELYRKLGMEKKLPVYSCRFLNTRNSGIAIKR